MVSETPMMCTMSSGTGVFSWAVWIIVVFIFLLTLFIAAILFIWWIVKKNKIQREKNEVQTKEKRQVQKRRIKKT